MADAVERALRGGASAVQLRDKTAEEAALIHEARLLLPLTRRFGVPLIVNDSVAAAREAGADGVHLGQEDGSLAEARKALGETALIGRSTHSIEQAAAAEKEGFDYIGLGPVYPTPTKPGRPSVGLELVRLASAKINMPFVAIGGIDETNVRAVLEAGAERIAVVRAVMASKDPEKSARLLLGILGKVAKT